ncbi:hypothetical protein PQX77_012161 [Marasmius sp. AFHP31]|nr:hypothetical protein PQX77_012161 [Marasmius sp. AFHP31]
MSAGINKYKVLLVEGEINDVPDSTTDDNEESPGPTVDPLVRSLLAPSTSARHGEVPAVIVDPVVDSLLAPSSPASSTDVNAAIAAVATRLGARIRALEEKNAGTDSNGIVDVAVSTLDTGKEDCPSVANAGSGGDSRTSQRATALGIVCPKCDTFVTHPEDRWYTIWCGRAVGWIKGRSCAMQLTLHVEGQGFRHCSTEQAARALYHEKKMSGEVRIVNDGVAAKIVYDADEGVLFP